MTTAHFSMLDKIPKNPNKNSKVIIMLHGVGSNADDLFSLSEYFHEDDYVFSLNGPFETGPGGHAWYRLGYALGKPVYDIQEVNFGYEYILEFIEMIRQKYDLSSEQIYLFGFSQGAIMSYYLLSKSPKSIHGVIGLSGRMLKEIGNTGIPKEAFADKRVFVGHGKFDTVIAATEAERIMDWMQNSEINSTLHIYDMPHSINDQEMKDIVGWLNEGVKIS